MSSQRPHFGRVAVIGTGLIGSSLLRVFRREGMVDELVGCARRAETRERILELGIVDRALEDPTEAVDGADLVIIAIHLGGYAALADAIAPKLKAGAIVTDVGSAKATVLETLGPRLPEEVHLVPGHPIAGTEFSGPDAGFAELFRDRWCIITPPADADPSAVKTVAAMWRAAGSAVETMDAEHHDLILAITSHLPHVIAYTIVGTATELEEDVQAEVVKFSAGGFRDFTRIAATKPDFWRDVFLTNRDAVLEVLDRFTEDLSALRRAIRRSDGAEIFNRLSRTQEVRKNVIDLGQDAEWRR
ncbi:MAG: prephenate/arogenate dehydrogenase family protein [Rhodospirillaceae bacterium]|nr:prephenate/arogenate dehydrogenase family protein [Rhodospirillaceae bacterium]MCY4237103.1 prephenate/arogenate dehydrogenase family protein [Rhodospirillaceae bacterium]MCY4310074.1 prephenate/arogenate dehydrogenase family protein [Rhodospirillaceae bacterium]